MLQLGESQFGAGLVVRQAQALAGEQPTLETAAAERPAAVGTGVSEYNDDFGELDGLLEAQGGLPPQSLSFPSLEPDPEDDLLLEDDTPSARSTSRTRATAARSWAPAPPMR